MLILINLDAAVERRRSMTAQLQAQGVPFERVGVDLRRASAAVVAERIRACARGLAFDRDALSSAEIGCWLSHLSAWQRLLEAPGVDCCTVIEDDLVLAANFKAAIGAVAREAQFDVVYLGTSSRNLSQKNRCEFETFVAHRPIGVIFNTWGYRITRRYVERFFDTAAGPIRLPIDHFLGGRARWARPSIAVLQPAIVAEHPQLGVASQIGPYSRRIFRNRWFDSARRHLLASPLSQLYYAMLYRYL